MKKCSRNTSTQLSKAHLTRQSSDLSLVCHHASAAAMPPSPFPTPFLPLRRGHLCVGIVLAPACTAPEVEVLDRTHLRLTTSPKQSGITTSPTAEHTTIIITFITAGGIQLFKEL